MLAWRVFNPFFGSLFMLSLRVLYPGQDYGR
jgi:hypothetical protein